MSDPHDVPPEFAETFHAAYREALEAPAPVPARDHGARSRAGLLERWSALWSHSGVRAVVAGAVALLLVLAAYGIGRAFSGPSTPQEGGSTAAASAGATTAPYAGKLRTVKVRRATASCTAPPAVDGAGHRVTYGASNLLDGVRDTAWRCEGRGVGVVLTFTLPPGTTVAAVGLVPGYAKTDPVTSVDRYAQDNRVTTVRWRIGDRRVVQRFSADPHDRSLRLLRVPATAADRVRLTILSTARGSLDITAITEVRIKAPRAALR
ncbi:MAG: NADase-type glycan-binding domain-containing protein [Marmoricola sp.]